MTVKRFVTKPVEIEAILFDGTNFREVQNFTGHHYAADNDRWVIRNFNPIGTYVLANQDALAEGIVAEVWDKLHHSWIGVKKGQWIIKGTKGEFYPCDPETFDWKYKEVL